MRIEIDTDKKTLKLESSMNLQDLYRNLKKLFPNGEWKEYTLEANSTINWNYNPIILRDYTYPTYPWLTNPYFGTTSDSISVPNELSQVTYQVEITV